MANLLKRYRSTLSYIGLIALVNIMFLIMPTVKFLGAVISPADFTVGIIYVMRDFTQREIKHYVIVAMLIGSFLSYLLATKDLAIASVSAFLVGEFVDWSVYTFTRKPLSQRILWSSLLSSPFDSALFLYLLNMFNWVAVTIMTVSKMIGVIIVWYLWRYRYINNNPTPISCAL